jgi:thioesterase domain-containing protein
LDPDLSTEARGKLSDFASVSLCLGDCPGALHPENLPGSEGQLHHISPDTLSTLLLTSGSTGNPKGVVQSHRNTLVHAGQFGQALKLRETDRVSGLFPYHFPGFVLDMVASWLAGSAFICHKLGGKNLSRVSEWVDDSGLTVLHCVTSVFRTLLQENAAARSGLRIVDVAGEPLYRHDVEQFRHRFPGVKLLNHYAMTECSVIAQFDTDDAFEGELVPVGEVPPHLSLEIVEGQVLLSGEALWEGYWNSPKLTAERLVEVDGRTYFQTGDLGRLDDQGRLYHLGRQDARVKVRSHTVDLRALESALIRLPQIRDAAVSLQDGRICVFLLCVEADLTTREVREILSRQFPEAWLPDVVQVEESFPRTPAGKILRNQLVIKRPGDDLAPQTPLEKLLALTFCRQLSLEKIGMEEELHALGLNSLKSAQLELKLQAAGVIVGAADILDSLNLRELAGRVESGTFQERRVELYSQGSGETTLILFHDGGGDIWRLKRLAGHFEQAGCCYTVRAFSRRVENFTMETFLERYGSDIREARGAGPCWFVGFSMGSVLAYETACAFEGTTAQPSGVFMIDPVLDSPSPWKLIRTGWKERKPKLAIIGAARAVREWLADLYFLSRLNLGYAVTKWFRFTSNRRLLRSYRPKPLSTPVVIVENDRRASRFFRSKACHLEVHLVQCEHLDMLETPNKERIREILLKTVWD